MIEIEKEEKEIKFKGKHSFLYFVNSFNFSTEFFNLLENKNNVKLIKKQFISYDLRANFYKEIFSLQKLNKYPFVPKLIYYDLSNLYFIMEYINGVNLKNLLKIFGILNDYKIKKKILNKIYKILIKVCIILDLEGIFKDEWNRPFKHVIFKIKENKILGVYIIDFDRANFNKDLKNLPQFLTFVFNNLKFNQYFYLLKKINTYYRKIFSNYLNFVSYIVINKNYK